MFCGVMYEVYVFVVWFVLYLSRFELHVSCLFNYFYFAFFLHRKLAACVHIPVHRLRRDRDAYRSSRATWPQQCATQAGSSRAHLSQRLHSMKWYVQVYVHRLRRYLGAYLLQLGHVDAIIFSAGVGENSPEIRRLALADLQVAPCFLLQVAQAIPRVLNMSSFGWRPLCYGKATHVL